LGFKLLRQLGMGEFGACTKTERQQLELPGARRVEGGSHRRQEENAILEAEDAMQVGRALARVPHLMRLYDTGKLKGQRFTYHVLQLINGDTLDN